MEDVERKKELEAIMKLDEAITALKKVGYKIRDISVSTSERAGMRGDRSRRDISMCCIKELTEIESRQMSNIRQLVNFKNIPSLQ